MRAAVCYSSAKSYGQDDGGVPLHSSAATPCDDSGLIRMLSTSKALLNVSEDVFLFRDHLITDITISKSLMLVRFLMFLMNLMFTKAAYNLK